MDNHEASSVLQMSKHEGHSRTSLGSFQQEREAEKEHPKRKESFTLEAKLRKLRMGTLTV